MSNKRFRWIADREHVSNFKKLYSKGDKQEIMAQRNIWLAIPGMMGAKNTKGDTDPVMVTAGIAAKKQMVLYALVGEYGWDTAIKTVKNVERTSQLGRLGLPTPVMNPVTYIKAERSYGSGYSQNNNTYRGSRNSQPFSRGLKYFNF